MNTATQTTPATAAPKRSTTPPGVLKRTNQFFVDPKSIKRKEGWNPRFDMGEIKELADQIKHQLAKDPDSGGLLNDLRIKKVGDGTFELVDGDRRLTAIEMLMKAGTEFPSGVPAKLEAADADELELLIKMFVANDGKKFLPLEEAIAFKRMRDAKMTIKDIEKATGRSDNTIVGSLALLDADTEVIDAVKNRKITGGDAKAIAVNARGNQTKQRELVRKVVAAGKDKKARKAAKTAIDDSRRERAAARGRKLKIRALTDEELSTLGARVSEQLVASMAELGLAVDTDLVKWVKDSDADVKIAYSFGALQAFKAAAGVRVQLSVR